jgi:4-amino-4-deoxy-L-arabinose transferase-like glycosyltransferase
MSKIFPPIFIGILGIILFIHSLGAVSLFDWDEINFAESAREMLVTGDFTQVQINFLPFWEKPPLFIWMQALSMYFFGINEWAARLPNAICGVTTLLILWNYGNQWHTKKMATWWVFLYAASFLPHLYFKSGIIDPWFNLFIFCAIHSFFKHGATPKPRVSHIGRSGLFLGLAVLTKGPVAFLITGLTILGFFILQKKTFKYKLPELIVSGIVALLIPIIWLGFGIAKYGMWWISEFLSYQWRLATTEDAGHGGFPFYHFVVLLFGCFPASALALNLKHIRQEDKNEKQLRLLMICLLGVVLLIFSIVKTKILHYSSLAYFPITYLAAIAIDSWRKENEIPKWNRGLLMTLGLCWSIIMILIPFAGNNSDLLKYIAKNDLNFMASLEANVNWPEYLYIPGIALLTMSIYFFHQTRSNKQFMVHLIAFISTCLLSIQFFITFFIPRIEQYTQHAAIKYFTQFAKKDVYIGTLYYKSYAPYFYAQLNPKNSIRDSYRLIINGSDKPCFFVGKINSKEKIMKEYGNRLLAIDQKNGFVLYQVLSSKIEY